jgi:hypothetical protein
MGGESLPVGLAQKSHFFDGDTDTLEIYHLGIIWGLSGRSPGCKLTKVIASFEILTRKRYLINKTTMAINNP